MEGDGIQGMYILLGTAGLLLLGLHRLLDRCGLEAPPPEKRPVAPRKRRRRLHVVLSTVEEDIEGEAMAADELPETESSCDCPVSFCASRKEMTADDCRR